jgi:hypothetical protein
MESGLPSTGRGYWVFYSAPKPIAVDVPSEATETVEDGKWMLFYPREEMDARWREACENVRAGRFGVVSLMKASTFKENPRSSDPSKGVIVLYTPETSKNILMETGRRIMEAMNYQVTMYFKTNSQTFTGTAATGQSKNHTFYIRPEIRYQDIFAEEEFP